MDPLCKKGETFSGLLGVAVPSARIRYSSLADRETEAQRPETLCPVLQSDSIIVLGKRPWNPHFYSCALIGRNTPRCQGILHF